MAVHLRDYQDGAVQAVRGAYVEGFKAPLLVAPTGAGKTVVFSYVASTASARGKRVLILVHRRELIRQSSAKLTAAGVEHGIIAPGHTPMRRMVQVASVQTIANRLGDPMYADFDLIIADEAHHSVAGQWAKVLAAYPGARLLGVTATPERLDGRGLGVSSGGPFDTLVMGPAVADLMARGFLVPARVFAPEGGGPDLSGVETRGGDYAVGALAEAMDKPGITGDAAAHYRKLSPGLPAVAFCASVKHAEHTAAMFRADGWRAVSASGETPTPERDAAIGGLATGKVQVLCTCDLISEGLDVPAIAVAILLRPTKSLGLHLQQVGRGLRPVYAPGGDLDSDEGRLAAIASSQKKVCLVLDHAGNTLRHGLPDEPRTWSLDGRKKRDKTAISVKQCPQCFAVHGGGASACPSCGHSYLAEQKKARELDIREGELKEIDGAMSERLMELRKKPLSVLMQTARTRDDLQEIAKARGYRPAWVHKVMTERQRIRGAA